MRNISTSASSTATRDVTFGQATDFKFALRASYAHEFEKNPNRLTARFVAGGDAFTLAGATPSTNTFSGGAGASWEMKGSTLSLDYDAEKAGPYLGHTMALTYRARF